MSKEPNYRNISRRLRKDIRQEKLNSNQGETGIKRNNLIKIVTRNPNLSQSRLATLNVRSLKKHLDITKALIYQHKIDIFSLTETWLQEEDIYTINEVCPPGYTAIHEDRKEQRGGGLAVICSDAFKPKRIKTAKCSSFENLVVRMTSASRSLRLVTIYRPPSNSISTFCEEFKCLLEDIGLVDEPLIISGDFNVHWDDTTASNTRQLREVFYYFALKQHVNESTHCKGHILDYIISRESEPFFLTNTYIGDLVSDHRLVCCDILMNPPQTLKRQIQYRKIEEIDINAFKKDILESDLLGTYMDLSLDELLDAYNNVLLPILDKHAPLITKHIKNKPKDPWVNDDLLEELRLVRRLERKWRKSKLNPDKNTYEQSKERAFKHFAAARSRYLEDFVEENNADQGTLFKAINKIMHRKNENPLPEHESSLDLANEFSDFFQEKVAKIRQNFSEDSNDALFYDTPQTERNFTSFNALDDDEITKIISQSTRKYCELDPIPSSLLKQCTVEIMPVIKRIIKQSICDGYFPKSCKKAIVKPLLKKPNLDSILKNYRPVSNLSYIGKLIEKSACVQISKYMSENSIGEPLQSAYKANHSTETAILWIFDQLLTNLDNNNAVLLTLLDLSAAFDTVDHKILLERLRVTQGITDNALKWFSSYLQERTMQVCVNGEYSKPVTLDVSLPQGSQLGPRLYSDYTQPIGQLIRILQLLFHGYADDTQLLKAISSVAELESALQHLASSIKRIGTWMNDNKLKLSPEKNQFDAGLVMF